MKNHADGLNTMATALTRVETFTLFSICAACVGVIANTFHGNGEPLIASIAFSGIAFAFTFSLIRWLGPVFLQAGFKGRDMCKVKKVELYVDRLGIDCVPIALLIRRSSPETMGALCAAVYLLIIIIFIPFPFYKDIVAATSGGGNRDVVVELAQVETGRFLHRFPHSKVSTYVWLFRVCHTHILRA